MRTLKIVSATRLTQDMFWIASYLGRSLQRIPEELRPAVAIHFGNSGASSQGLPEVYNEVLFGTDEAVDLVFVHDDVYINDWCFVHRVAEALERFDVVGVAGSLDPDLTQPSWALHFDADLNPLGWQPDRQRSGVVNHFDYGHPAVSVYGPTPRPCGLLDGLLLAVRTSAIRRHGICFDPQFRFHCYDLDFCRVAAKSGLRIGTWPIAVTHDSGGNFGSCDFKESARRYLDKWATEKPRG